MKPRARKFRIRPPARPRPDADGAGKAGGAAEREIADIRREGLTGRQLRTARRIAMKHGLKPASDYDAVRLLRQRGIDPFERANLLDLVVPGSGEDAGGALTPATPEEGSVQLPQTTPPPDTNLPSTELGNAEMRARQVLEIQRDIARRRRRRQLSLLLRLLIFVILPTVAAGYYFANIATPMYATNSEFVIQKSEGPASGVGGLLAGTQFATSQDSITVQGYLQSRDAMLRLDRDHGFRAAFSEDLVDPLQALPDDASNEAAYKLYRKHVRVGFDPTEGTLRMEVSAPSPEASAEFSRALISYAEQQVDNLTKRLREEQMRDARKSYEEAVAGVREAQQKLIEAQEKGKLISGDVEVGLLTNRISALEMELTKSELALEELKSNPRPNQARVAPLERKIALLREKIEGYRKQLTEGSAQEQSIARKTSDLALAQAELESRNLLLQAALQQLESARIEANRQVRYLAVSVPPIPPDEPTYPRVFENTAVAFLVFAGLYLMVSLTVSILREQVSS